MGAQIAANGVQFMLVIAGGYTAWEVVNLWVNRRLARERGADEDAPAAEGEPGGGGQSRLASVLPLIQITLQIAIVVISVSSRNHGVAIDRNRESENIGGRTVCGKQLKLFRKNFKLNPSCLIDAAC